MSLFLALILLVAVGIALALIPMDPAIKRIIIVSIVGVLTRFSGSGFLSALNFCNAAAGSNAVVQITLER